MSKRLVLKIERCKECPFCYAAFPGNLKTGQTANWCHLANLPVFDSATQVEVICPLPDNAAMPFPQFVTPN